MTRREREEAKRRFLRRRLAALAVSHRRAHGEVILAAEYLANVAVEYDRVRRAAIAAGVKVPQPTSWWLR